MIKLSTLSDAATHLPTLPSAALDFLLSAHADTPCGRYEFGDTCYVNVMSIETSAELGAMEAHREYIDVQVLLDGQETIFCADTDTLALVTPYDPKIDAAFYALPSDALPVAYCTGEAVVLFPRDAHLPGRATGAPMTVKKAVLKLRVASV